MHPKDLSIHAFDYDLPEEKIAVYPLENRDLSRLLIYEQGNITEDIYANISGHLPENSFLVFNDTKVIKARLFFPKPTGATIEIFCLEPYGSVTDYTIILQQKGTARWKCLIGGAEKWKEKYLHKTFWYKDREIHLKAGLVEKLPEAYVVEFNWDPVDINFGEIIGRAGNTPLPPYIKRKPGQKDAETYQTIYSANEGSVAAPTAGLHFTRKIFDSFQNKNIQTGFVTLHVGAGTFKPVKSLKMNEHIMHAEWMDVSLEFLNTLADQIDQNIICVGTTSLRTIESLYWMGLKILTNPAITPERLALQQWEVYEEKNSRTLVPPGECIGALTAYLSARNTERLFIQTQIIIAPGYTFKIAKGLVTNFHQPKSTLLLLVSAIIGEKWKTVYNYALSHNFRFLSYGDGMLLKVV